MGIKLVSKSRLALIHSTEDILQANLSGRDLSQLSSNNLKPLDKLCSNLAPNSSLVTCDRIAQSKSQSTDYSL